MTGLLYLLLICFGALFVLAVFQFSIYIQQRDKAFLYYALYLGVMSVFTALHLLDARLTNIYPLTYHQIQVIDPLLSNTGFVMYVNFLGVILNITKDDAFFYRSWKLLQKFVAGMLLIYVTLHLMNVEKQVYSWLIILTSTSALAFGAVLAVKLFQRLNDTFFRLILTGTLISVTGVITGVLVNAIMYSDITALTGLYFVESSMLAETIFLSAAMGYRIRQTQLDKISAQQQLIDATRRSEQLALQTASLLQKELDIQKMQKEISKDLHDDVGASLSSIHIYSTVAERMLNGDNDEVKQVLKQISSNAQQVLENMGDIVWSMNVDKEDCNFADKIKNMGTDLLSAANISCSYEIGEDVDCLVRDIRARKNIYLAIKEAFNNMAKYSMATAATLRLSIIDRNLMILVSDNGIGYDAQRIPRANGIKNIVERIEQVGGKCIIDSTPGKGTSITGIVPITTFSDTGVAQR